MINDKYYIIINDKIKILIKQQDYFHIILVIKLFNYKKKYFRDTWFDEYRYVNTNFINIEKNIITELCNQKGNKKYRVDTHIKLHYNYYLGLEYFEKNHNNLNDLELRAETHRFYDILYGNKDESTKIVKIIVFWYTYINDNDYINNVIKKIYNLIHQYKNIDDERKWCIDVIDKEVIHSRDLSEHLYDGFIDYNKPLITFEAMNKIIQWKNDNFKEKCYLEFKKYINELEEFNNKKIILIMI